MRIYVLDHSSLPPDEVRAGIRAVNAQVERHFEPLWGRGATLVLKQKRGRIVGEPDGETGVIHLVNETHVAGVGGFHEEAVHGLPVGYSMTDLPERVGHHASWLTWSVAFSHEVLEMIADPFLNLLAKGPHPRFNREVYYYREVCDPVQGLDYRVNRVKVSNFVLPHYFNCAGQDGHRNDYLDSGLKAFRWKGSAGLVGFIDPHLGRKGQYVTYPPPPPKSVVRRLLDEKAHQARLHRYTIPCTTRSQGRASK